jgi:hypothetical protein
MNLRPEVSVKRLADRLRQEAFLRGKSLRRQVLPSPNTRMTAFVAGVQRSGTNMLIQILGASYETDVFNEDDKRAFDKYLMREPSVIHSLVTASRSPVIVVKALNEAHDLTGLLKEFAPAKAFWMIRHFEDAVNSLVKRWPGFRNMADELARDRNSGGWRGKGMTDETHRNLRQHYRREINDATANALFWYYRNQLFFDQRLAENSRVLPIRYENLVRAPEVEVDRIAAFLGIRSTDKMRRIPHAHSVRKDAPPEIDPGVKTLCESMYARLLAIPARAL